MARFPIMSECLVGLILGCKSYVASLPSLKMQVLIESWFPFAKCSKVYMPVGHLFAPHLSLLNSYCSTTTFAA